MKSFRAIITQINTFFFLIQFSSIIMFNIFNNLELITLFLSTKIYMSLLIKG